jgi:galactose mutarotase-like enzyme
VSQAPGRNGGHSLEASGGAIGAGRCANVRVMVTLRNGPLEATIAPQAALLVTSLRHHGEELLGRRADAEAFVRTGKTTGAPLLYPWANRLGAARFEVDGRECDVSEARRDGNGLPMHGLPEARRGWVTELAEPDRVAGHLEWDAPGFPFRHVVRVEHRLTESGLETTTEVQGDTPVAFGWHPFLQLPGEPRERWRVRLGARTRLELDDRMLPTGARAPLEHRTLVLGGDGYDEALADVDGPFMLEGERRRIAVRFLEGAPYAHFFAPAAEALVSFEPMAAPGNALVTGDALAAAPWRMRFAIDVG